MHRILFVCIHNSARSQIAEAFLNQLGSENFQAESAGLEKGTLNPWVVRAMQEVGIDISKNQTKEVFDLFRQGKSYQVVITVCEKEAAEKCPIFPGVIRRIAWSFPDPSKFMGTDEEILQQVRTVRDAIKDKVIEFIKEASDLKFWMQERVFESSPTKQMKKYIAELIGTFALVFCGTGAIVIDQETAGAITHVGVAITFGLIIMSMIHALGDISGCHINPAVTIAFTIAKRFKVKEVFPYILSQLIGAVLASFVLRYLFPQNETLGATLPAGEALQSFILEFILTFFLMLVIINVATGSKEQGMFAGLAIGAVVLLEAMFAGPICGASMNPARSIAPAFVSGHTEHVWIYVLAPITGAAAAIPLWSFLRAKRNQGDDVHP